MKLIRTIYMLGLLAGLSASCSEDSPLDGEQYFKQVYIVGAYDVVQKSTYRMVMSHKMHMLLLLREVARTLIRM